MMVSEMLLAYKISVSNKGEGSQICIVNLFTVQPPVNQIMITIVYPSEENVPQRSWTS